MMSTDKVMQAYIPQVGDDFLDYALSREFGDIHFKVDPETGMKAIIAIHNTKLGPALGGCRFIEYPNLDTAIRDAMRLARGMSYKAALVNLPLGGGKSVIIKPKGGFDRVRYMRKFGQFVQELNGRYITALDSGTTLEDMDIVGEETPYIASLSRYNGDPSPSTAKGVYLGLKACASFKLGKESLHGLHIAIQGLGHVGFNLAKQLHEDGATLTVADVNQDVVKKAITEFGAKVVESSKIHSVACDIFSPCALGAVINDTTIDELQTPIIAGAANNQLAQSYHGELLHEKGILFAVDYVINAGGLIYAASKYFDEPETKVLNQIQHIPASLLDIFNRSIKENKPTNSIADKIAQEKIK